MPLDDNFTNATVITGTSGSTIGSNTAATVQTGEPGHPNYNPGPAYPVGLAAVGPFASVWYSWTPSASGNYYFSTRDLSGGMATNFKSTLQAFTGSAVNSLAAVTLLLDQSVGDGNGADNGASIAFAAVAGTTYYLQVDGRVSGATGNFKLRWGAYNPIRLGTCSGETLNFDTRATCVGSVNLTGTTADAWFSFGSQPVMPGNYLVCYVDGTPVPQYANGVYPAPQVFPNVTIIDGDFSGFTRWDNTAAYSTGAKVIQLENYADYAAAITTANIPAPDPGSTPPIPVNPPYTGGGSCNAPWVCYNAADTIQTTVCGRGLITHPQAGVIGLCLLVNGTAITPPYPSYSLLYYPMDATVLNTSAGFNLTGSGTSWSITFNLQNNSDQTWDNTTVALLNTGGLTGASVAQTGLTLSPHGATTTGSFTFRATPGLVTATLQLSRNGQIACTLSYPLYPVLALSFTAAGGGSGLNLFERTGCTPPTWVQAVRATTIWPPVGALPSSWGDTVNFVFSIASGPGTLCNDNASNNCLGVANIAGSVTIGGITDNAIKPSFQVTGVIQSVPIQCTLSWNGLSLPTFTQTLSLPAA